jgi:hypothetical protein
MLATAIFRSGRSRSGVSPKQPECNEDTSKDDDFDKVTMPSDAAIDIFHWLPCHPKLVVEWILIARDRCGIPTRSSTSR